MDKEDNLFTLKMILREADVPFFTDEELQFYLDRNGGDFDKTAYQCLCIKAEDTTLSVSGLSMGDSSTYFRRMANMYRPSNSGTLGGIT
jgi:hypothetical protein